MLTYEQALTRILSTVPSPRVAPFTLDQALGLVLAKPVTSGCDLPRFDQSAVDGYAVHLGDRVGEADGMTWRLIGRSEAGRPFPGVAREGEAVRILTGAQVPEGANAVVMQEDVAPRVGMDSLEAMVITSQPRLGQHIRRQGEDLREGAVALAAGTRLRPQELALLASLGYRRVPVYQPPTVTILSTGDELRSPGSRLKPGQLYDSNTILLQGLLQRLGVSIIRAWRVKDALQALVLAIHRSLAGDLLLISGGVSVGDKDFVREAAARCGIRPILWQVDIKPGMPLFVGRRRRTLVFGLPGNPVSVLVNFEEFVKPAIFRLMGRSWQDGYVTPATLTKDLAVSQRRRTHFIRVRCLAEDGGIRAEPLNGQGSHQLASLTHAEGWLRMDSADGPWRAGTRVRVKQEAAA